MKPDYPKFVFETEPNATKESNSNFEEAKQAWRDFRNGLITPDTLYDVMDKVLK